MLGRTHLVAGAIAGEALAAAGHAGPLGLAVGAALGMGSAWLPDIDMASAGISRALPLGRLPGRLLKHRGPTHSLGALALYALLWSRWAGPAFHFAPYAVGAAVAGYATHLVLDTLSGGVEWLWPLLRRPVGVRMVRTGGALERSAVYPLLLAVLLWCSWRWR